MRWREGKKESGQRGRKTEKRGETEGDGNGERVSRRAGEVRRRAGETEILKVGDIVKLEFVLKVEE